MRVKSVWLLPAQPPLPQARMRSFQLAAVGSHTSMPMPAEVDGAPAGPGFPGPTRILTRQTSEGAVGGAGVAGVFANAMASPALNDLTSNTVVSTSGLKAVLIPSSQDKPVAGGGLVEDVLSSLPPQPEANKVRPLVDAMTANRLTDLEIRMVVSPLVGMRPANPS